MLTADALGRCNNWLFSYQTSSQQVEYLYCINMSRARTMTRGRKMRGLRRFCWLASCSTSACPNTSSSSFWILVALLGCCSTTSSRSNIFGSVAFQSPRHIATPRKLQHQQPRLETPLFSASLEEGEDLLLSGVTPTKKTIPDDNIHRFPLQRVYERGNGHM